MTASPNYKCHGRPGPLSSLIVSGNYLVQESPCLLNSIGHVRKIRPDTCIGRKKENKVHSLLMKI